MIDQLAWVAIPLPQGIQGVEPLTFSFRSSEGIDSQPRLEAVQAENSVRAGCPGVYTADSI